MFEYRIQNPQVRQEIETAGFKPSLEALAAQLHSQGYAAATLAFYDQAAVHFAYWIARRHLHPSQVSEAHITNFLSRHLPTCRCPFGGVRQDKTVRAGLRHRSLDTTTIYTKVDLPRLARVAAPWPEEVMR